MIVLRWGRILTLGVLVLLWFIYVALLRRGFKFTLTSRRHPLPKPPTLWPTVQKPTLQLPPTAASDAESVKEIFTLSYERYKLIAFGHDDVNPIKMKFMDTRNGTQFLIWNCFVHIVNNWTFIGWGASIVDAMGTMASFSLSIVLFD